MSKVESQNLYTNRGNGIMYCMNCFYQITWETFYVNTEADKYVWE